MRVLIPLPSLVLAQARNEKVHPGAATLGDTDAGALLQTPRT